MCVVLNVSELKRSFDGKSIIKGVSFTVHKGEVFGFLGPNGSGKTTIIRMILGLIKCDSGAVEINGFRIDTDFTDAIRHVGGIVETPTFYNHLSGYANLLIQRNLYPHLAKNRIDEVLEMVGLQNASRKKVHSYSLGMKQRLGIARALLHKPSIIFLDEPTNGLDPKGIIEIREMISQLAIEQDITFIITSHHLHEIEQICNRVAILREGTIIADGLVKELLSTEDETISIHTKHLKESELLLQGLPFVKHIKPIDNGLLVKIEKGKSIRINRLLTEQGVEIQYIIPQNQSLEQLFLELTKEGLS